MQTIALYGLYVDCDDSQHEEYMQLKADLESALKKIEQSSVTNNFKGKCVHYVCMENGYKFSFCLQNQQLQVGVVTPDNKQLLNRCNFDIMKGLKEQNLDKLMMRAVNMISNPERYFIPMKNLENMWERAIIEREKERLHNINLTALPLDKRIEVAKAMAQLDIRERNFQNKEKQVAKSMSKDSELSL